MLDRVHRLQPAPSRRRLLVRLCLFAFCGGLLLLLSSRPADAAERREPRFLDPVSTTLKATAREVDSFAGRATGSGTSTVAKAANAAGQVATPHPRPATGAARPTATPTVKQGAPAVPSPVRRPAPSTSRATSPVRTAARSTGTTAKPAARLVKLAVEPVARVAKTATEPVATVARTVGEPVVGLTGPVLRPLGPVLALVGSALAPVGSVLAPVGSALAPVIGPVGGLLPPVVSPGAAASAAGGWVGDPGVGRGRRPRPWGLLRWLRGDLARVAWFLAHESGPSGRRRRQFARRPVHPVLAGPGRPWPAR